MSKTPAFALAPGPAQRAVAGGVTLYVVLLVAVPFAAMTHAGLASGLGALWEAVSTPVARSAPTSRP